MRMDEILNEDLNHKEMYDDFMSSLRLVFSEAYLNKIKSIMKKDIRIKSKDFGKPDKSAYTVGRTIYINTPIFERLDPKQRTDILLHEFIHVIQNTKNFFILRAFKEVFTLGNELYKIAERHIKNGSLSEFLTGSKTAKIGNPKTEIVGYLMNGAIDWTVISEKGRERFIAALDKSGMFNLKSDFWHKRLI